MIMRDEKILQLSNVDIFETLAAARSIKEQRKKSVEHKELETVIIANSFKKFGCKKEGHMPLPREECDCNDTSYNNIKYS